MPLKVMIIKENISVFIQLKVNQQRHVVESILQNGAAPVGLETGSKPELLAALSMLPEHMPAIICNGYKDREYIRLALIGQRLGPHTGTPVPGGLDFYEAIYLIKQISRSGRTIIGFDLNEVSPGRSHVQDEQDAASEWDANVGARLLYQLCGYTLRGNC